MTELVGFAFVGILCVLVVITFLGPRLAKIESRQFSMDAKLDLLLKQAGLEYSPYKGLPPTVIEALQNGNKIEAIKRYREIAHVGLKEAKDFIEDAQRRGGVG